MCRRGAFAACLASALLLWAMAAGAAEATLSEAIRGAAAAVKPAVVTIEIKGQQMPRGPRGFDFLPPGPGDPEEMAPQFEFHLPPGFKLEPGQQFLMPKIAPFHGLLRGRTKGSGLIVEAKGDRALIAAPEALVAHADKVTVKVADGRELAAKVLGSDPVTGIACLEVQGPNLAAARLGKAGDLQVGDFVAAVGGPDTGNAVTVGIVSAKDRPGAGELAGATFVQTDALVTEAMAGGPLVSLKGEVVGMTFESPRGAGQGRDLTAALPVDAVQTTVATLAREGKIARGYLGISLSPVPPELQRELKVEGGVQVMAVMPKSPAAAAGIQAGDILVEFAGRKIMDLNTFRAQVAATRPGTQVPAKVLRGAQGVVLNVTLGEMAGGQAAAPRGATAPEGGDRLSLGVTVQPLTPPLADQFGYQGEKGLLVTDVDPNGPAAMARPGALQRGDLIKEVSRKPVASVAEAQAALKEARDTKAKSVLLLIRSKDNTQYVVVDLAP